MSDFFFFYFCRINFVLTIINKYLLVARTIYDIFISLVRYYCYLILKKEKRKIL